MSTGIDSHHDATELLRADDQVADRATLPAVIRRIWHTRFFIFRACGIVGLGAGLIALLSTKEYTSSFAVVPQQDASKLRAGGLAAQFGINLAGADMAQSPDFYVDLVKSAPLVAALTDGRLPVSVIAGDTVWNSAVDLLRVVEATPAIAREETMLAIAERISSSSSLKTGVISVSVRLPNATASYYASLRLLALLNAFNDSTRQSRAKAETRFLEAQASVLERTVQAQEEELERFLQRNRLYEASPTLRFDYDRMMRKLDVDRTLLGQLRQQLQQARVEAVRDTPLLTVVAPAKKPVRANRRYIILKAIAGSILTLLSIGVVHSLLVEADRARYLDAALVRKLDRMLGLT